MNCFFAGADGYKILLNILMPRKIAEDSPAVLLCYPFGQEYMRAHRAYRQLANLLSRKGYTVMRFDYSGTGDSYGDGAHITFCQWVADAQIALQELITRSGSQDLSVIGLRLGALIAAQLAVARSDLKQLILWDPFANGGNYLRDCQQQLADELVDKDIWRLHGFPMPRQFREEISKVDIEKMNIDPRTKIHQVISHENSDTKTLAACNGGRIKQSLVPGQDDWNYVDMEGSILMPTKLIQNICSTLSSK